MKKDDENSRPLNSFGVSRVLQAPMAGIKLAQNHRGHSQIRSTTVLRDNNYNTLFSTCEQWHLRVVTEVCHERNYRRTLTFCSAMRLVYRITNRRMSLMGISRARMSLFVWLMTSALLRVCLAPPTQAIANYNS